MLAVVVYGAGVITDEELAKIRCSGSYRAAIWLARFNFIPFALELWLMPARKTDPDPWFFPLWLLLAVSIVTGLLLLRRSGVPFVRRGLSWTVRDRRMMWQLYKDLFWFRRP